jgi:DNA-binding MarR family transcriptional regulator
VTDDVPDDSLGEVFGAVARQLRVASMAALARFDVTPSQVRAIRVLEAHGIGPENGPENGGVRSKELAEHLRIAPRSATEVVDALEEKGLVARSPDPGDRRAVLVSLTDRGRALAEEVRRTRGVEAERMFERLTQTEREHLARILRKLQD